MSGCGCYCHMPGCRVLMPDGDACCADRDDDRPPIPRADPPPAPDARVTEVSSAVPTGRKHAQVT